jgi:hypothetical protein
MPLWASNVGVSDDRLAKRLVLFTKTRDANRVSANARERHSLLIIGRLILVESEYYGVEAFYRRKRWQTWKNASRLSLEECSILREQHIVSE